MQAARPPCIYAQEAWPCPLFAPRHRETSTATSNAVPPREYDKMDPLEQRRASGYEPAEGDVVAFKLVQLDDSWTPTVSAWREGSILGVENGRLRMILAPLGALASTNTVAISSAQEDSAAEAEVVEYPFEDLVDARVVSCPAASAAVTSVPVIGESAQEVASDLSSAKAAALHRINEQYNAQAAVVRQVEYYFSVRPPP